MWSRNNFNDFLRLIGSAPTGNSFYELKIVQMEYLAQDSGSRAIAQR